MFKSISLQKLLPIIAVAVLLTGYGLLLAHPINLVTADLGRHIKNGEMIWQGNFEVLKTNFYSYTYPDFPTTNHHWLSGLVFYGLWQLVGFKGIDIFFILTSLATLLIFFRIAVARSSSTIATLITLPLIPILLERNEVRPEIFSYLFAGIFFWLILKVKDNHILSKYLLILPFLQIIWTNLHIYFFVGPVLIGAFLVEALTKKSILTRKMSLVFLLSIIATTLTPFGLKSTLAPLTIFKNFGYRLVENQPVWFIEKILPNLSFSIFKLFFIFFVLSFVVRYAKTKNLPIAETILALGFSLAAWFAIRNFAIFGLFALPIMANNIGLNIKPKNGFKITVAVLAFLIVFFLAILSGELKKIFPYSEFSIGLEKGNLAAAEFIKKENIQGPIFNNYDIGGYLIYSLPTKERVYPELGRGVFVDNRPEAYPASFFQETLIPIQEDEKTWNEKNAIYKFNAIIFSYRDYTPWGQTFFTRILQDPEWKTVFTDNRVVILLKNNELNKDTIAKYGKSISIKKQ
ncbi:MAG: hypothetical protein AAB501_02000 [Patescibacteria group bacterium]